VHGFDCKRILVNSIVAVLERAASELTSGVLQELQIDSYIRGYHAYMDIWTPVLNEELILKR